METLYSFATPIFTILFPLSLFLYSLTLIWKHVHGNSNSNTQKSVPQAGGAIPFIGHLHLLGRRVPAHITLGKMADKYGPIFTIKLGVHRALVVSDSEIAKECFTSKDKALCSRPKSLAGEILGYNFALIGLSPYGPYWRQIRKIAILEVLSNHRLEMLKHVRDSEVESSLKEVYDYCMKNGGVKVLVDMKRWFSELTLNVVLRMVVGKRFAKEEREETDRSRRALKEWLELTGAFTVADAMPFLRWLDLDGYEKAMKKTAKELDDILGEWLEEHKVKRALRQEEGGRDFMGMMLSILDDAEELHSYDADTINKANCLALILGGTDTTTVTMTWAVSLLLNNHHVLKKAHEELDTYIGRERQVNESDIENLVYLQAILKETLRLYPAAPLLLPHESMTDCTVAGYHVAAGTRLLVNLPKLHRDHKIWPNPHRFEPERFLTSHKDVDVRGQSFELLSFSSGRRICPGISFALQVMELTLAKLLHCFEFATPNNEAVDMTEGIGITNPKATPLDVLLTPRLPAHLYV